jgi:hypothetical protein
VKGRALSGGVGDGASPMKISGVGVTGAICFSDAVTDEQALIKINIIRYCAMKEISRKDAFRIMEVSLL